MDSLEKNNRSYGGASRPPAQEGQDDTPLFSDMTYAAPRRTPNNGRPDYSAAKARSAASQRDTAARYDSGIYRNSRRTEPSGGPRPGSSGRTAPVYTEISWDQLYNNRSGVTAARPEQSQPAPPQPAPPQPQQRTGSPYFGGFEQEMGELFYGNNGDPDRSHPSAAGSNSPLQGQDAAPRTRVYIPSQQNPQYRVPSKNAGQAPRQVTPLQSIRETAYRQAARSNANRPPQRPGTPAPAKRAAGAGVPPMDRTPPQGGSHVNNLPRSRSGSRRNIPPVVLGCGVLLLALAVFLLAKIVGDSGSKTPAAVPVRPSQSVNVSVTPVPENTASPETTPGVTPTPTPEPTPTPSGPKAKLLGDLIVPADWGPVVPERKKAVYDSFFDRSVMIGNSLTEGFFMWAGMEKNMEFIYGTGATVSNAVGGMDLAKITLNKSDYYSDIYLMFGLNEIGTDVNSFVQNYKRLVDYIREHQTRANIYIISVTPVTRQVDEDPNEVQNMTRIRNFNAALKEFCADQNCWYLDIYNLLLDKNGYLSGEYAFVGDGKHFEKSGYVAWANYMKTHYVDEGLLKE